MTERELFVAALELDDADARSAFLDWQCADRPELRQRLAELLRAHGSSDGFLKYGLVQFADAASTPEYRLGFDTPLELNSTPDLEYGTGAIIAGRYTLKKEIGAGGMGRVWLAEQTQPVRRDVAIKLIKAGMDSRQVLARFEAERHALALMDHPNIAKVLDGGATEAGRPFFVMEVVTGLPITTYSSEHKLSIRDRLALFIPVCLAVQHAHQKGVIHRDLKPSNILVSDRNGVATPKIIDFGLAKALQSPHLLMEESFFTAAGTVVGTPIYMAPEQTKPGAIDADTRTDVYTLGVILYEMLTGRTPLEKKQLQGASWDEICRIIRETEPPRPSEIDANLRGDLDWIALKALEKDPERRYESASALAADIERHLANEPVQARSPSELYRIGKFVRRHRGAVLAATLVILALIGGIVASTSAMVDAKRARDDEFVQRGIAQDNERKALAAAEAEKKANETARLRETETQAALEFVESRVFAAARPKGKEGGLGFDVTLRQALQAAVPYVASSFADEPLIEARLRMTLGLSFKQFDEPKLAAEQFHQAQALYTRHLGPNHLNTLRSAHNLACSYNDQGQFAEAAKLHEETLATRKLALGPDHLDVLSSMHDLATSYHSLGRYQDALQLREAVFEQRKRKLGDKDRFTLSSAQSLANSYRALGRHIEAVRLDEETLALRKTVFGPEHPEILSSFRGLARSYTSLGRHNDAVKIREESLALHRLLLGDDDSSTHAAVQQLAISYYYLGRNEDARRLNEETWTWQKAKLGPDNPDTLNTMNNLANCYSNLGRTSDALRLFEELLPMMRTKRGADHPETLRVMNNLALEYAKSSRHEEAMRLREETLALRKAKLGDDHPDTLASMFSLAQSYKELGRQADSLELHEKTLTLRKARSGLDHPLTLRSMHCVAEQLYRVGRGDEAVPMIDDCVRRAATSAADPSIVPSIMDLRLWHFKHRNDARGCRETADIWEKLNRTDADSYYRAARYRAATATIFLRDAQNQQADAPRLVQQEADLAMDWLRKSVPAKPHTGKRLEEEGDFAVLRERENFKALLAELKVTGK